MNRDTLRQAVVAVSAVLAVIGSFIGSGAAGGTPIQQASNGALAADATPVAPGGPAFAIWTAIYLGLLAYARWQFLPAQKTATRQRQLGYPIAASLILNAAWILTVQFDIDAGFGGFGLSANVWAVVVVALAALVGVALAVYGNGRLAPAASLAWGLAWVAVARLAGDLLSTPAAIAAIVAVVVVVLVTVLARLRSPHEVTA